MYVGTKKHTGCINHYIKMCVRKIYFYFLATLYFNSITKNIL